MINLLFASGLLFQIVYSSNIFVNQTDIAQPLTPACNGLINKLKEDAELAFFESLSLFFSSSTDVCEKRELVVKTSQRIHGSCNQVSETMEKAGNYQQTGIYQIWANEQAASAACSPFEAPGGASWGNCLDFVASVNPSQLANNVTEKTQKLCNSCQKDYWSSVGLIAGLHPHLYYAAPISPMKYVKEVVNTCGDHFFGPDIVETSGLIKETDSSSSSNNTDSASSTIRGWIDF